MTIRWSFVGHPLRDDLPAKWPENLPVREEPGGAYVYRERTEQQVPVPRCLCTGLKSQHGTDRRGRPTCFHSPVCGCREFRPATVAGSIARHPAGKGLPTDTRSGDTTA